MPPRDSRPSSDTTLISARLADYVAGFSLDAVPAEVRVRAKHLMLDSIGIALASTRWDFARDTLAGLRELAGADGDVPVIGFGQKLPLRDAVVLNALLAHGLDYDDTHPRGVLHITTSVLPAALGLATRLDKPGRELLAAYVAGVETTARLASCAKGGFHQVGFHPTGLVGAFGCTLAASYLLGLPADAMVHAQGIALSLASGSLEFLEDGAGTKRLHPGWAGAAGITAATLAKHGFTGPRAAYEGRFGLYASHLGELADRCDPGLCTRDLGGAWETLDVAIKPIPACHFVHACADAASLLHARWNGAPVARIIAKVPQGVMKTVCEPIANKRRPSNAYDAQFSIPYAVATGLRFGRFTLDALETRAIRDPATLAIAGAVECRADPGLEFPRYYGGEVIVELADGKTLRHREAINRGCADRPIDNDGIVEKFRDNAARAVAPRQADAILETVLSLETGQARDLAERIARVD